MESFINFYPGSTSSENVVLALVPSAMHSLKKLVDDTDVFFQRFTSNKSLIVTRDDDTLYIYTDACILRCVKSDREPGLLLIRGVSKNSLNAQNRALSKGTRINVNSIAVKVTVEDYPTQFFCDGELTEYSNIPSIDSETGELFFQVAYNSNQKEENISFHSDKNNRRYNKILDLADSYAEIFAQAEQRKANETLPITYFCVKAPNYKRIDRVEYVFVVREFENENYRIGSQILINENYPAEIVRVEKTGENIEITALFHNQVDKREIPETGQIHLSYTSTISDVQKGAVQNLRSNKSSAKSLGKIIGGFATEPYVEKEKITREQVVKELNDKQLEAIEKAVNTEDIFLIMGPPGTGKTSVIIELVRILVVEKGLKVLVSSQNNTAIDNVMKHLINDEELSKNAIRIGTESRVAPEVIPFLFENKVREYRKHIVESTDNTMEYLEDTLKQLAEDWPNVNNYAEIQKSVLAREIQFDSNTESVLLKKYIHAENLLNKALKEIEKRDQIANEVVEMHEKVSKYVSILIIHLFTDPGHKKDIQQLKEKIGEYKRKKRSAESAINSYQKARAEYEECYQSYFEQYESLYNYRLAYETEWQALLDQIALYNDRWMRWETIDTNMQPMDVLKIIEDETERFGELKSIVDEWRAYTGTTQNYAFGVLLLESVNFVGATCIGISSQKKFDSLTFDVAIIDEAGQIQVQNALVPMSVAPKTIMLGDYQQIPPGVDIEIENHCREHGVDTMLLSESFFEYLYKNLPDSNKIMLDTQYRMPSQIADILSAFFYDGNYHTCAEKKDIPGRIGIWKSPCIIIDTSKEKKRYEVRDSQYRNEFEAKTVYYIVSKILDLDVYEENEIHIIAPYKEQVDQLQKEFEEGIKEGRFSSDMKNNISTLDSYQGQECELIVYCFTRSSKAKPDSKRIGFLREVRRLNVAMSRCRQNLILIGDMKFLSECKFQEKDDDGNDIYEGSEKRFSDFIKVLIEQAGKTGLVLDYEQVVRDLGESKV